PRQTSQPGSNTQWKYRGRTGSEINSSDPLSAPTGLDKQSSEGFQRFFKAVVSPTHVRVTAGGRIVPNTRNSVSPTTKWDKERLPIDAHNSVEPNKETRVEPVFASANNQVPPPMVAPIYQQPVIYQQMGMPIPLYHPMQAPMQHGFAYPYGFAPLAAPVSNTQYLPLSEGEQRTQVAGSVGKQDGENDNKPRRAPVKLSPPEQFDQNRPFYANGQLVFPPAGLGPGPMPPMVSNNHFFAPGVMPAAAHTDPRMVAVNHPSSNMPIVTGSNGPPPQPYSGDRSSAPQPILTQAGPPSGTMPPLSSIRPSEITRKQLENLRNSLKYYVGQLQFNRHQIDEPWVFAQAQKLRDGIKQFEHNYQMQIRFEMEHYPNMEPTPSHISELAMRCNTPSRPPSIRHTPASGSSHHGSIRSIGPASSSKHSQLQQVGTSNRGSSKPNRAAAMLEAITRPLNPKYDTKALTAQQFFSDNSSSKDSSIQPALIGENKQMQQRRDGHIMQPGAAYLANTNPPYIARANGNRVAIPYLVGNYPPGADPWTYQGHEFVYARELTEAEKQARNTYWGKLPSKGTGLPKFDGKDFYPASPQKGIEDKGRGLERSKQAGGDFTVEVKRSELDPFRSSRDANSIRSYESGRKFSKAIPIVAPPEVGKKAPADVATVKAKTSEGVEGTEEVDKLSHVKSGHDLWQSMLKKGSTSASVLPSAISATTATGYLPQYAGNAIASFGPTISNGSPARVSPNADDKLIELEGPRVAMEKIGENCPPSSAPSMEHDITKDLHQRMLRDAERRGVIGSDWQ
ncbi:hypothetical protein EV127DRAFT_345907, partial [Xylaria flabelliformis]